MTETSDIMANGAGYSAPQPSATSGFDAGNLWDGHYVLRPYVDAEGDIPIPTQQRIDNFRRKMGVFALDLQKAADDAARAQRKAEAEARKAELAAIEKGEEVDTEPFDVEKAKADLEEAIAEERRIYDEMREHVATFCQGHPTKAQLNKLPDAVFLKFVDFVGGLINPNS